MWKAKCFRCEWQRETPDLEDFQESARAHIRESCRGPVLITKLKPDVRVVHYVTYDPYGGEPVVLRL